MNKAIYTRLQSIPITELFDRYHIKWEEGRNFKRPWGNTATGRTPSCRYYPETNSVGDFGTHKGGGPINFVALMENISFKEAVKLLMQWYNIEDIPAFSYQKYLDKLKAKETSYNYDIKLSTISTLYSDMELTKENLTKISLMFASINLMTQSDFMLLSMDAMKKNLEEFVFLIDEDIRAVIKEDLGLVQSLRPAEFANFRQFSSSSLLSGMCDETDLERWSDEVGRYLFPIFYPGSIPFGFSGRSLKPDILKYLTRFEFGHDKKDILYGLDKAIPAIKEKGYVILVEGILDTVRCRSVGYNNVVAPMSTYLSAEHIYFLKPFTNKFILAFDNDQGGDSAAELSAKNLDKHNFLYERVLVPKDTDPDSFGKDNPELLKDLLTSKW